MAELQWDVSKYYESVNYPDLIQYAISPIPNAITEDVPPSIQRATIFGIRHETCCRTLFTSIILVARPFSATLELALPTMRTLWEIRHALPKAKISLRIDDLNVLIKKQTTHASGLRDASDLAVSLFEVQRGLKFATADCGLQRFGTCK